MTRRYTDDDVTRLVKEAAHLADKHFINSTFMEHRLRDTLAPFLPDPEDELIEKMWDAFAPYKDGADYYRKSGIRAALAVVKREGLPE